MNRRWLWASLFLLAIFFWWRQPARQTVVSTAAPQIEEPAAEVTEPPHLEPKTLPSAPVIAAKASVATAKPEPKPTGEKSFKLPDPRQLDMPKPASIKELLEDRTGYQLPKLPVKLEGRTAPTDSDIWAYYAGYAIFADESFKKLRLQRNQGGLRLAIEEHPGDVKDWSEREGALKLSNFKGDPYSVIMDLPDGRVLYLKFQPKTTVTGYLDPMRTMTGWLLSDSTLSASVARVALIDIKAHIREYPPGQPGAEEWPKIPSLKALTSNLPTEAAASEQ